MASPRLGMIDFGTDEFVSRATEGRKGFSQIGAPTLGPTPTKGPAVLGQLSETRPDSLASVVPSYADVDVTEDQPGAIRSGIHAFVQGVGGVVSAIPKSIASVQEAIESGFADEGDTDTPVTERFMYNLGKDMDEGLAETFRVNPEYQESFGMKLAGGAGSLAGFAAGGFAGILAKMPAWVAPVILGSMATSAEATDDLIAFKKSKGLAIEPSDYNKAAGLGAIFGVTEGLPVARAMKLLGKATKGQFGKEVTKSLGKRAKAQGLDPKTHNVWKEMGKGAIYEGVQEAFQTTALNWIARDAVGYDKDRELYEGTIEGGSIGAILGSAMNLMAASLGNKRIRKYQKLVEENTTQKLEKDVDSPTADEDTNINPVTKSQFASKKAGLLFAKIKQLEAIESDESAPADRKALARKGIDAIESSIETGLAPKKSAEGQTVEVDPVEQSEMNDILNRSVDQANLNQAALDITDPNSEVNQNIQALKAQKEIDDIKAADIIETHGTSAIAASEIRGSLAELRQAKIDAEDAGTPGSGVGVPLPEIGVEEVEGVPTADLGVPTEGIEVSEEGTVDVEDITGTGTETVSVEEIGDIVATSVEDPTTELVAAEPVTAVEGELVEEEEPSSSDDLRQTQLDALNRKELLKVAKNIPDFGKTPASNKSLRSKILEAEKTQTTNITPGPITLEGEIVPETAVEPQISTLNRKALLAMAEQLQDFGKIPRSNKDLAAKITKLSIPDGESLEVNQAQQLVLAADIVAGGTAPTGKKPVPTATKDGKVYYGKLGDAHIDVIKRFDLGFKGIERGFSFSDGKVLSRKEASERLDIEVKVGEAGELDAQDVFESLTIEDVIENVFSGGFTEQAIRETEITQEQAEAIIVDAALSIPETLSETVAKARRVLNQHLPKPVDKKVTRGGGIKNGIRETARATALPGRPEPKGDVALLERNALITEANTIPNFGSRPRPIELFRSKVEAMRTTLDTGITDLTSYADALSGKSANEARRLISAIDARNKRIQQYMAELEVLDKVLDKGQWKRAQLNLENNARRKAADILSLNKLNEGVVLNAGTSIQPGVSAPVPTSKPSDPRSELDGLKAQRARVLNELLRLDSAIAAGGRIDEDTKAPIQDTSAMEARKNTLEGELFGWDTQIVSMSPLTETSIIPDYLNSAGSNIEFNYAHTVSGEEKTNAAAQKQFKTLSPEAWNREAPLRKAAMDRIISSVKAADNPDIEILFVSSLDDVKGMGKRLETATAQGLTSRATGFYMKKRGREKTDKVVIYDYPGKSVEALEWTAFHEIVGHYGFAKMFKKEWGSFLNRATQNKKIASAAYDLKDRWPNLANNLEWKRGQKVAHVTDTDGNPVRVNAQALEGLVNEYVAELAGKFSDPSYRSETMAKEGTWLKRITAYIKHILRKSGFGKIIDSVTEGDLLSLVSESYVRTIDGGRTFNDATASYVANTDLDTVTPILDQPEWMSLIRDGERDAALKQGANIEEINAMEDALRDDVGELNKSWWRKVTDDQFARVARSSAGRWLTTYGGINMRTSVDRVRQIAGGKIGESTRLANSVDKILTKMNPAQKEATNDYYRTAGASLDAIPGISSSDKRTIGESKEAIVDLGQRLVDLGLLSKEVFEANKGSYLPTRYFKYIETSKGTRSTSSLMNYLKKQKALTDTDKAALGKIDDPQFIVPETLATIGRDVALQEMSETLIQTSYTRDYGWVLGPSSRRDYGGRLLNAVEIEESVTVKRGVLASVDDGATKMGADQVVLIEAEIAEGLGLIAEINAEITEEAQRLATMHKLDLTGEQMLAQKYKQLPNSRGYGAMRGAYVHPDMFSEYVNSTKMFNPENMTSLDKMYKKAQHAHMFWKTVKVPFNPPSWGRNFVGNAVLMDTASKRNMPALMGMLRQEFSGIISGNQSKYEEIARRRGVFTTTFSATELNEIHGKWQAKAQRALKKWELEAKGEKPSAISDLTWMFQNKWGDVSDFMTNIYGGMEGGFKTVMIRDHIETWEKENGQKLEDISKVDREALENSAVRYANEAIFDYSDVPPWLRQMRQTPFGAPFMTFMYKSGPAMFKNLARNPKKFIKYAALPYLMQALVQSTMDWDDDKVEQMKRSLPMWTRTKASIHLVPDFSGDQPYFADFGYFLPWGPYQNTAMYANENFDQTNPVMSTLDTISQLGMDIGFFGGPVPSAMSAIRTNIDSFTGREIIRPGATQGEQLQDISTYLYNMWTPSMIGSTGVFNKALNYLQGEGLDERGNFKEDVATTASRAVGINVYKLDPAISNDRNKKAWESRERDIKTQRGRMLKNQNIPAPEKQVKLREYNDKLKLLRQKRRAFFQGN